MMTGNNGSTHGASTVNIPAKNEINRNVIVIVYIIKKQCKVYFTLFFVDKGTVFSKVYYQKVSA
jgi:hypothetical protein